MTTEQRTDKALHIINAALNHITEAAEGEAVRRDHAEKYKSCYTMEQLDHERKASEKAAVKCAAYMGLHDEIYAVRETVKALDLCAWYEFYPKLRQSITRHCAAYLKKSGEPLDFISLYYWIYDKVPADYWNHSQLIREDFRKAYQTLTLKKVTA